MPRFTFIAVLIIATVQCLSLAYQRGKNKDINNRLRTAEARVDKLRDHRADDIKAWQQTDDELDVLRAHVHDVFPPSNKLLPLPQRSGY